MYLSYAQQEDGLYPVESCCESEEHIKDVMEVMQKNILIYLNKLFEKLANENSFEILRQKYKVTGKQETVKERNTALLKEFIAKAYAEYEKDCDVYREIMDKDFLEEYEHDPATFKKVELANRCPVTHYTLYTKAKELAKYKSDFRLADPQDLYDAVRALTDFAEEYSSEHNDADEEFDSYVDMDLEKVDSDKYGVQGVIGGGIRSHFLYKYNPALFPNRSRSAIWALYHLSDKKSFDCRMDSEFLMLDTSKNTAQHNYYYPYGLFSWYAYITYNVLNTISAFLGCYIDPEKKYAVVDAFLNFVYEYHAEEIKELTRDIPNGGLGNVWA